MFREQYSVCLQHINYVMRNSVGSVELRAERMLDVMPAGRNLYFINSNCSVGSLKGF